MKKSTLITFLILFLVTAVIQAQDTLNFDCSLISNTVTLDVGFRSCEGTYYAPDINRYILSSCGPASYQIYSNKGQVIDSLTNGNNVEIHNIPIGEAEIHIVVEDSCGNRDSCMQIVVVQDRVPPVAICDQNFNLTNLPDTFWFGEHAKMFDDGSVDFCGPIDFTFVPPYATCDNIPAQVIMYVTDEAGNSNTCMINITNDVRDDLLCKPNMTYYREAFPSSISVFSVLGGDGYDCASNYELELATDEDFNQNISQGIGELEIPDTGSYYIRVTNTNTGNSCWTSLNAIVLDSSNLVRVSGTVHGPQSTLVTAFISNNILVSRLDSNGLYDFYIPRGEDVTIQPLPKNDDYLHKVTSWDVALIERHLQGVAEITRGETLLAADVNRDGEITSSDLSEIDELIRGEIDSFSNSNSWTFYPADIYFRFSEVPQNFAESISIENIQKDTFNLNFRAVKMGNVSRDSIPNCEGRSDVQCKSEVSLDFEGNCSIDLHPYTFLSGSDYKCAKAYNLTIARDPIFTDIVVSRDEKIRLSLDTGIYYIRIIDLTNNNSCWTSFIIEDSGIGSVDCNSSIYLGCDNVGEDYYSKADILYFGSCVDNYSMLVFEDEALSIEIDKDTVLGSERFLNPMQDTFYVVYTDLRTGQSCTAFVTYDYPPLDELISIPEVTKVSCTDYLNDPSLILPENTGVDLSRVPDLIFSFYKDHVLDLAGDCDKIIREWTFMNWCTSEEYRATQVIDFADDCSTLGEGDPFCEGMLYVDIKDSLALDSHMLISELYQCDEISYSYEPAVVYSGDIFPLDVTVTATDTSDNSFECITELRLLSPSSVFESLTSDTFLCSDYQVDSTIINLDIKERFPILNEECITIDYQDEKTEDQGGLCYLISRNWRYIDTCLNDTSTHVQLLYVLDNCERISYEEVFLGLDDSTVYCNFGSRFDLVDLAPDHIGRPNIDSSNAQWTVTYNDVVFDSTAAYCAVIQRNWTAISYCLDTVYNYTQIIRAKNECFDKGLFPVYVNNPYVLPGQTFVVEFKADLVSILSMQDKIDPGPVAVDSVLYTHPLMWRFFNYTIINGVFRYVFTNNLQQLLPITEDEVFMRVRFEAFDEGYFLDLLERDIFFSEALDSNVCKGIINYQTDESFTNPVCTKTIIGAPIRDVDLGNGLNTGYIGCAGFEYENVDTFVASKNDQTLEGIDALDALVLLDFVLGLDTLAPFQQFAADLNHDGIVNTDDLALMRQWLRNEAIPQGQMWFFFDDQQFNTQIDLFVDTPAQFIEVDSMVRTDYEFVGIKKGDLNYNYASSNLQVEGEYLVMFKDDIINAGQQYSLEVKAGEFAELQTLDLGIAFDKSRVNILYIESEFLSDFNISENSNGDVEIEFIATLQELLLGGVEVQEGDVLFELVFEAQVNSILSEEFALNQNHQNIVKQSDLKLPNNVVTEWENKLTVDAIQHWVSDVVIYPNPTSDVIYIDAKDEGLMNYKLMDLSGRIVLEGKTRANEAIDLSQVASGMYLFEVIDQKSNRSISKLKVF